MRILYFAWLRERLNRSAEDVSPPAGVATVGALLDWLAEGDEAVALALAQRAGFTVAVNARKVSESFPVAPGDTVAILPPMTGG